MTGYSTRDVAGLLGIPEHRIRAYARAGIIQPARGPRNEYILSFQDLVLLRTAAELMRASVPARRVGEALARLKAGLPDGRALSELRIHADGDRVVVRERNEPPWNPESGQFHMEFDVADLGTPVTQLPSSRKPEADPNDTRTAAEWFDIGVELEASAPDEARAAYEHSIALEPDVPEPRVNLARLLHEAGFREEAEAQYRRVLARGEHALAAYNLGVLLEDMKRDTDAIQAYARAIAADPELAEAHYNLARLYEQRGDRRAAIRHFNGYRALVRPE